MNHRVAFIDDGLLKELQKVPLNEDFSPRENEPWLFGPAGTIPWQIRVRQNLDIKIIVYCKDIREAANLVMLLRLQNLEIEKYKKKMRKILNKKDKT